MKKIIKTGSIHMPDISFERFIGKEIKAINEMCPIIIIDDGWSLTIECSWRLRNSEYILIGCTEYDAEKTHDKANEKLKDAILGKAIKSIQIKHPVSDLVVEFEDETLLELFSDSNIYESWTLNGGEGFCLISATAGQCVFFGE